MNLLLEPWKRASRGLHTVVLGLPLAEPPQDLRVVRVSCDVPQTTLGPLLEARARIERVLGTAAPFVEVARARVMTGLRRHLLGDLPSVTSEGSLVDVCNRLAALGPAALVLEAADAADGASLDMLRHILGRAGWLHLPVILVMRGEALPMAAAQLVDAVRAAAGDEAIVRASEAHAAAPKDAVKAGADGGQGPRGALSEALRVDARTLPAEVLRVLRVLAIAGSGSEVSVLAAVIEASELSVLDAAQRAADAGVPIEDRGEGRFHLPPAAIEALRASILPSLAAALHRRVAAILGHDARATLASEPAREPPAVPALAVPPNGEEAPRPGNAWDLMQAQAPSTQRPPAVPASAGPAASGDGAVSDAQSTERSVARSTDHVAARAADVANARAAAWEARADERAAWGVAKDGNARADQDKRAQEPSSEEKEAEERAAAEAAERVIRQAMDDAVEDAAREAQRRAAERAVESAAAHAVEIEAARAAEEAAAHAAEELRRAAEAEDVREATERAEAASAERAVREDAERAAEEAAAHAAEEARRAHDDATARAAAERRAAEDIASQAVAHAQRELANEERPPQRDAANEERPSQRDAANEERPPQRDAANEERPAPHAISDEERAPAYYKPFTGAVPPPIMARPPGKWVSPLASEPVRKGSRDAADAPRETRRSSPGERDPRAAAPRERADRASPAREGASMRDARAPGPRVEDEARAARHLAAAGDAEAAIDRYFKAMQSAVAAAAYPQAVAHAQAALALLDRLPASEDRRLLRVQLLLEAGRVLWHGAGPDASFTLQGALRVLEAARTSLHAGDPAELVADVSVTMSGVLHEIGDIASLSRALDELANAARALSEAGLPQAAARLFNDQASVHIRLGDPVRAAHLLTESRKIFEESSKTDPIAMVEMAETDHLFARILLHVPARPGREDDALSLALDHAIAAERAFRRIGAPREAGRVLETQGRIELRKGRLARAADRITAALKIQESIGDVVGLARSTEALSEVMAAGGQVREALALLADSMVLNFEKGSPLGLAFNRKSLETLTKNDAVRAAAPDLLADVASRLRVLEEKLGRVPIPGSADPPA